MAKYLDDEGAKLICDEIKQITGDTVIKNIVIEPDVDEVLISPTLAHIGSGKGKDKTLPQYVVKTIPAATAKKAGVMTAEDKTNLDNIKEIIDVTNNTTFHKDALYVNTNPDSVDIVYTRQKGLTGENNTTGVAIPVATTEKAGVMSATDKQTLDDALSKCIETTYADLRDLKDGLKLVPGQLYRITDYELVIPDSLSSIYESDTTGAYKFDIIIEAIWSNRFSERARVCRATNSDVGGVSSKIATMKIWYCFDNDTKRFEWADSSKGKGVIYRMIDEYNNDLPYDFIHLKMEPYGSGGTDKVFTFTLANDIPGQTLMTSYIRNIKIEPYIVGGKRKLNRIVFQHTSNQDGLFHDCIFEGGCYNMIFNSGCYGNQFGSGCFNNIFKGACYGNQFGSNCSNNSFNSLCYYNQFGSGYSTNNFKSACYGNQFGSNCSNNSFNSQCYYNQFGSNCSGNIFDTASGRPIYCSFGSNCSNLKIHTTLQSSSFGNYCRDIEIGLAGDTENTSVAGMVFGDECYNITIGRIPSRITFGAGCSDITIGDSVGGLYFGTSCSDITIGTHIYGGHFGPHCHYIHLGDDSAGNVFDGSCEYIALGNNCTNNHFGTGCRRIGFWGDTGANLIPNEGYVAKWWESPAGDSSRRGYILSSYIYGNTFPAATRCFALVNNSCGTFQDGDLGKNRDYEGFSKSPSLCTFYCNNGSVNAQPIVSMSRDDITSSLSSAYANVRVNTDKGNLTIKKIFD